MRGPHNLWRLIITGATFERSGAMKVALEAMDVPPRLRLVARVLGWPFAWLGLKGDPALPPVTRALTALGPAYIKFGQVLSTRPDVVGIELAEQLTVLQDRLPPFSVAEAKASVAAALGQPVDAMFTEFSEPVAAASIAQVHSARRIDTGAKVAVKVLRPGIERAFQKDLDAFHFAARLIELVSPSSRRLRPSDVIAHFESVVLGELDLRMEASAALEFCANTANDAGFAAPRPHWDLSARRVMTLDWVDGIALGDIEALQAAGHDLVRLSERVLQLFLSHALRDGYFHADMHQGNLKVAANGDIVAYDFGIMGQIDEYTRRVYAEILMGFIRKDYRRVAEVHFEAADLRHGRKPHLNGPPAGLSVRGDGTVRHADPHRTHPVAAHDGGGRGGFALAQPGAEHVGSGKARGRHLHPPEPWAAFDGARSRAHRKGAGTVRAKTARDRGEPASTAGGSATGTAGAAAPARSGCIPCRGCAGGGGGAAGRAFLGCVSRRAQGRYRIGAHRSAACQNQCGATHAAACLGDGAVGFNHFVTEQGAVGIVAFKVEAVFPRHECGAGAGGAGPGDRVGRNRHVAALSLLA
jgi:hypothetical protein